MEDRREGLSRLATHYGFEYMPDKLEGRIPADLLKIIFENQALAHQGLVFDHFEHIWPFCHAMHSHASDVVFGPYAGHDWTLFDYGFHHAGEQPQGFGVISARIPCTLPSLYLAPENLLDRAACRLGVHEMTFEVEEFNRRYFIRADDERSAYDILHPQAITYLLGLPARNWQIRGSFIVVARNRPYSIDEISKVMGEIDGFIRLIPGYVLEDQGFTPDWKGPLK